MAPSMRTIAATRFGYGFHPRQPAPASAEDLLAEVKGGAAAHKPHGAPSMRVRAEMFGKFHSLRRRNKNDSLRPEMKAANRAIGRVYDRDLLRRVFTPVNSPYGFYERLAWFWTDHFAVVGASLHRRAYVGRYEHDAIRPHIAGRFHDMLRAASSHPSMMLFLNQWRSIGPASNSRTELPGSSLNFAASTQPAEPAPTMMKS